jgi:hypothetical protein
MHQQLTKVGTISLWGMTKSWPVMQTCHEPLSWVRPPEAVLQAWPWPWTWFPFVQLLRHLSCGATGVLIKRQLSQGQCQAASAKESLWPHRGSGSLGKKPGSCGRLRRAHLTCLVFAKCYTLGSSHIWEECRQSLANSCPPGGCTKGGVNDGFCNWKKLSFKFRSAVLPWASHFLSLSYNGFTFETEIIPLTCPLPVCFKVQVR